ncbi:MAG: hypothetical protein ACRDZM_15560 [Acidimicrobiia bacterium]
MTTFRLSRLVREGPGLAGPLRLTVVLAVILLFLVEPLPARAHGGAFDVVVEAVNRSPNPGEIAYGIVLTFVDGHEVAGASVIVSARAGDGSEVEADAGETTPGVYIADLTLDPGSWRVVVAVDGPDAEGSVEFSEEVGSSPITIPVVRVDSAGPDRQGQPVVDSSVFEKTGESPGAKASTSMRVEALVRDAVAPLVVEYGVIADVTDAEVSVTARSAESVVGPVALATLSPGVFSGVVMYPEGGSWQVTVEAEGSNAGTAEFTENLPWPHYTTEAGSPKIKVSSDDPSLEGSLIDITESPIFGLAGAGGAPSTTVGETSQGSTDDDVVISIPSSAFEVGRQTGLRWLHLGGIGLWAVSIGAIGLGRRGRTWAVMAIGGVVAVLATGAALMLWGAPIAFPGIFSWAELGEKLYGPSYRWAFLVKMAFVATGVVATAFLVTKSTRSRLVIAAGSMVGALAAVVVMAQLHLFTHL